MNVFNAICLKSPMSTQSRDSIALYVIAALAVLLTLYADVDFADLFNAILARW
jgi:hypothetical protein